MGAIELEMSLCLSNGFIANENLNLVINSGRGRHCRTKRCRKTTALNMSGLNKPLSGDVW